MAAGWWFGGWRSGQGESEASCCLVSQVKALSPWKQDWTCTDPTCPRLFSTVENVVSMACSNTVSYKYTHVIYIWPVNRDKLSSRQEEEKTADLHRKLQLKERQCEKFNYLRK